MSEFDHRIMGYFHLQRTESAAYSVYAFITALLPNSVTALVLLYGGHLVLHGEMSGGTKPGLGLIATLVSTTAHMNRGRPCN